jgi:hypothetical protein
LGAANTVLGAVNRFQDDSGRRDYKQTKALQDLEIQNAQERTALEKEEIRLSSEQTERERRNALRRAVAKQRAIYGGEGISSGDGSARAVLLGLFDESDEERKERDALNTLKSSAIDSNITQQKRLNTLQLTQLKEKNRLNRYTAGYSGLSSIVKE